MFPTAQPILKWEGYSPKQKGGFPFQTPPSLQEPGGLIKPTLRAVLPEIPVNKQTGKEGQSFQI